MDLLMFKLVEKSVSKATGISDFKIRNRKEEVVNAKRVFIQLLIDKDHFPSATSVAQYLALTHGTVLHHKKTNKWLLESQQKLKSSYDKSKTELERILSSLKFIDGSNNQELLERIEYHKHQVKILTDQLEVILD